MLQKLVAAKYCWCGIISKEILSRNFALKDWRYEQVYIFLYFEINSLKADRRSFMGFTYIQKWNFFDFNIPFDFSYPFLFRKPNVFGSPIQWKSPQKGHDQAVVRFQILGVTGDITVKIKTVLQNLPASTTY